MPSSSASRTLARRTKLDLRTASRFATIALGHVVREYPGRLDHVLTGPADLKNPRALHPVFFGSFDWHSCVHSHWLLATLYRLYPDLPESHAVRTLFSESFTKEKIAGERAYLKRSSAGGFERPYGWAWLLMLQAELLRHETPAIFQKPPIPTARALMATPLSRSCWRKNTPRRQMTRGWRN